MSTPTKTRGRVVVIPMPDLSEFIYDWVSHLEGRNLSPNTIKSYVKCAENLLGFLRAEGLPTNVSEITAKDLDAFLAHLQSRVVSTTAAKHYRSILQLFKFAERDEEDFVSPMKRMSPPKVLEKPVPVIPVENVQKMLDACKGGDPFEDRRDAALIRFMYDTGLRSGELCGMLLDDYDARTKQVTVTGKGRRTRSLQCGSTTIDALRRYLRHRSVHHRSAATNAFWVGRMGPLSRAGVAQMLERRCDQAGVPRVHPHQFRHTFAHNWLDGGGNEGDLMSLAGWTSREMLNRYAKSAAGVRARKAHIKLSPADRLLR